MSVPNEKDARLLAVYSRRFAPTRAISSFVSPEAAALGGVWIQPEPFDLLQTDAGVECRAPGSGNLRYFVPNAGIARLVWLGLPELDTDADPIISAVVDKSVSDTGIIGSRIYMLEHPTGDIDRMQLLPSGWLRNQRLWINERDRSEYLITTDLHPDLVGTISYPRIEPVEETYTTPVETRIVQHIEGTRLVPPAPEPWHDRIRGRQAETVTPGR